MGDPIQQPTVHPLAGFHPSAVYLDSGPPLCATMGRSEREYAAALLVWACQQKGDRWRPVNTTELEEMLFAARMLGREPVSSWLRNPFMKPDMRELADHGFARWLDDHTIELTEAGIERLRRWVRAENNR